MYKYIDNNYHYGISALKVFHFQKNFKKYMGIIFLLFTGAFLFLLWDKGNLKYVSPFLAAFLTYLYYAYAYRGIRTKAYHTGKYILSVEIIFQEDNMEVTSLLSTNRKVSNIIYYKDIVKIYENKKYYFLYKDKITALVIDKSKLKDGTFASFIRSKVKC